MSTNLHPAQRLHEGGGSSFKHGHVVNIYNWLSQYRGVEKRTGDPFVYQLTNRYDLVEYIKKEWNEQCINAAHFAVSAQYQNGERIYKRGRPRGSKNNIRYPIS